MEITKREVIFSISIISILLLIGIFISNKVSNNFLDENEKYYKALKIDNEELFQYGMDTNVGNAFVYGDLEAINPVSYPEISGKYMYIEKLKKNIPDILELLQLL